MFNDKIKNIDVVITSTCRESIERTFESFLEKVKFSGMFRFFINIDVLNEEYLPRLKKVLQYYNVIVVNDEVPQERSHSAHASAINKLFDQITSKYYFHLEDDWIFRREIDLDSLLNLMESHPNIHHIRFNKEPLKDETWLYYLPIEDHRSYLKVKNEECIVDGIALTRVHVWSFNPSLARSTIAKSFLPLPLDNSNPEKIICSRYELNYPEKGTYALGHIGEKAFTKDIGRNQLVEFVRKIKKNILMQ